MIYYKTFQGSDVSKLTGAYGHGRYDLSQLPVTVPRLEGEPVIRHHGYHVCQREHVIQHLSSYIYEVNATDVLYETIKGVTCAALTITHRFERWTPAVKRLFAADCAEHVLHLVRDCDRAVCVEAIRAARSFALGESGAAELAKIGAKADRVAYAHYAGHAARACHATTYPVPIATTYAAIHAVYVTSVAQVELQWQTDRLWDWLEGRRTANDVRRELEIETTESSMNQGETHED